MRNLKNKLIAFKVKEKEHEAIHKTAEAADMSTSEYLRHIVLSKIRAKLRRTTIS